MRKYKYGCQKHSTYAYYCWAKGPLAFLLQMYLLLSGAIMLIAWSVITLMYLSYYGLLSYYLQLCIKFDCLQCALLHSYIYPGGMA